MERGAAAKWVSHTPACTRIYPRSSISTSAARAADKPNKLVSKYADGNHRVIMKLSQTEQGRRK
jgi:hypothetical protein